jgi:pyruvate/oxaloacetate carboxyltransferase
MRDETPKIASATSHALVDAIHIMENAARGRFPCADKIMSPNINYSIMRKVIEDRPKIITKTISGELANKLRKFKEEYEKEVGVDSAEDFINVLLRKTLSDRKLRQVVAKKD